MMGKSHEFVTRTASNKSEKVARLPAIIGGNDRDNFDDDQAEPDSVITMSNLYKRSPTILFVKEKYKLYLDWLARNYAGQSVQPHSSHHLAWYDFEKSLEKRRHSDPQQLIDGQALGGGLDSNVAAHNQRLLAAVLNSLRNSKDFNSSLDAARKSQNRDAQKKMTKKRTPRKLEPIVMDESSIVNKVNQMENSSQARANNLHPLPNRVQFLTTNGGKNNQLGGGTTSSSSSYPSYQSSVHSTPPILKPILKKDAAARELKRTSGESSDYLRFVYLNRNLSKRKSSSTVSLDENGSTSGNSSTSSSSPSSSYGNKPLLPPILPGGPCSEDFYAVLNDLQKTKFV